MHLSVFVVGEGILLKALGHHLVGNDNGVAGFGLHDEVEDIKQFAGIAATVTEHGVCLLELYPALFQLDIRGYGAPEQFQKVVFLQ